MLYDLKVLEVFAQAVNEDGIFIKLGSRCRSWNGEEKLTW